MSEFVNGVEQGGVSTGADLSLDVTNFDGNLSASDTDAQTAFETLDDMVVGTMTDPWVAIANFDDQPPSSSTITVAGDITGTLKKGMGLKYTLAAAAVNTGDWFVEVADITYGSPNTTITIRGVPLETDAGDLEALYYRLNGRPEREFFISGAYADGTGDAYNADMHTESITRKADMACVGFRGIHEKDAGTTQPKANLKIGGAAVSTNDSNNGIQLSTSAVENPAVAINRSNYIASYGDAFEIDITAAAVGTAAEDLTLRASFVEIY